MNQVTQRLSNLRRQIGSTVETNIVSGTIKQSISEKIKFSQSSGKKKTDKEIAALVGGHVFETGLILIRNVYPLSTLHKCYDSSDFHQTPYLTKSNSIEDILFIDTETTGLSTASGTLVFLIGAAEIKGKQLILEQLLLTKIAAEKKLLHWFQNKCSQKKLFASYNGKSFDIPLLETRFKMHRIKYTFCDEHIDLLHWVRRLHKNVLPNCNLPTAEKFCLNFSRNNDLPGSEAPRIWQEILKFHSYDQVPSLIKHHANDIISLAGLLHYCEEAISVSLNKEMTKSSIDIFSLASYFCRSKNYLTALNILENNKLSLNDNANFLLSTLYRKKNKISLALPIWHELSTRGHYASTENLAKYFEHNAKDYDQALFFTCQLISQYPQSSNAQHRRYRLQQKLNRSLFPPTTSPHPRLRSI